MGARPGRRSLALGLAILVAVLLLLVGGYAEFRWRAYTTGRQWFGALASEGAAAPAERFEPVGDPGLLEFARRQRPAAPPPDPRDGEAFRAWQVERRHALLDLFDQRDVAAAVPVRAREISAKQIEADLTRRFLIFESFDGTEIPAYLITPAAPGPSPAIIVLPGHVGDFEEGISQTAGLARGYHHSAALALARAGYVTLTIEFRGFGYLGSQNGFEHQFVAFNALLGGSFYRAVLGKDIRFALELLRSRAEVDPNRIGVTGISLGGLMAATYAALDQSIRAVVTFGSGGRTGALPGISGTDPRVVHLCRLVPGHNGSMLAEDWPLLIAPRPLMRGYGDQERADVGEHMRVVRETYVALGAGAAFEFRVEPGGHEYFVKPAIEFFDRHL